MEITHQSALGTCWLQLAGELNIYATMELKAVLLEVLDAHQEAELDLANVTDIDSAGIQLLAFIKRQALAAGKTLRLVQHSPVVIEMLDLFKLSAWFGDPLVMVGAQGARGGNHAAG